MRKTILLVIFVAFSQLSAPSMKTDRQTKIFLAVCVHEGAIATSKPNKSQSTSSTVSQCISKLNDNCLSLS